MLFFHLILVVLNCACWSCIYFMSPPLVFCFFHLILVVLNCACWSCISCVCVFFFILVFHVTDHVIHFRFFCILQVMNQISKVTRECWAQNPKARLPILRVKKTLSQLLKSVQLLSKQDKALKIENLDKIENLEKSC